MQGTMTSLKPLSTKNPWKKLELFSLNMQSTCHASVKKMMLLSLWHCLVCNERHQATLDELMQSFSRIITDINAFELEFLEYQATPDDELPAYFDEGSILWSILF